MTNDQHTPINFIVSENSGVNSITDVQFTSGGLSSNSGYTIPASAVSATASSTELAADGTIECTATIDFPTAAPDDLYIGYLEVKGKDSLGRELSKRISLEINLDREPSPSPVIGLLPAKVDTLTIEVTGTATKDDYVELYVNGEYGGIGITASDGLFRTRLTSLREGINKITAIAEDAAGNKSEPSDPITIVYDPSPATPTGLKATAGVGQVTLSWNPGLETDLAGYNIYRSESPVLLGEKLNNGHLSPLLPAYIDNNVVGGKTYYYRISAVDNAGNESEPTGAISVVLNAPSNNPGGGGGGASKDTQAPAAPTGLKLNAIKELIHLVWQPNKEADLAGYNVYRKASTSSEKPVKLNGGLVSEAQYQDKSAKAGIDYLYHVTAVDKAGNESAPSEVEATLAAERTTAVVFLDIPASAWYANYVAELASLDIIGGYADGTFRPTNNVTRAEFAKMICLAMDWELVTPAEASFADVQDKSWAYSYVETAKAHGAIGGYPDGSFGPNNNITRAEIAKIVAECLDFSSGESALKDISGHWAKQYINACAKAGIIGGYPDGSFRPNNTATRAEAAKMVSGMLGE